MREKEIWDDWVKYDDDGFVDGLRPDAPDDVKKAYAKHLDSQTVDKYGRIERM